MDKPKEIPKGIPVRKTKEIKLKDKQGRNFIVIHLKEFGFIPENLIIEKVPGQNNKFVVMAILTDDMIKKQEEDYKKHLEEEKNKKEKGVNKNG